MINIYQPSQSHDQSNSLLKAADHAGKGFIIHVFLDEGVDPDAYSNLGTWTLLLATVRHLAKYHVAEI